MALVYPNSYYAGMSNLGLHTLYRLLNSYTDIVCERLFWEKAHSAGGRQPLSLESQRPLSDFAVIAFSVSFELDYLNIAPLLRAGGIPPFAADRDERHPLLIAGGACITANPMPVAPFFDCLCIGEAEAIVPGMHPVLAEGIAGERQDLLQTLTRVPGIYVPSVPPDTPVVRQKAECLDDLPVTSVILTPDTELGDLFLIEVERGCNWGCRFCLVSQAFSPMRFRSVDKLLEQAEMGLKYRKRIGLVGPAVTDHPHIDELVAGLRRMGARLSISSLRLKPLSPTLLSGVAAGGVRTIALAPEAGSHRLRRVLRKDFTDDDINNAVETVSRQGIKQIKLYFMIGLPTETDEDVEEIVRTSIAARDVLEKHRRGGRITLNIAPFVPKAGTPFQWLPMASLPVLERRLSLLKGRLMPAGIKVKSESPAWSEVQAVLARGDSRLAQALSGIDKVSLSGWRRATASFNLDIDFYTHRRWEVTQKLPWEMIDLGAPHRPLEAELTRALSSEATA